MEGGVIGGVEMGVEGPTWLSLGGKVGNDLLVGLIIGSFGGVLGGFEFVDVFIALEELGLMMLVLP